MKFCFDHWKALRDEVDRVGLSSLIPDSGALAGSMMTSEIQDGTTVDNFDPLMRAHNLIWARAMEEIEVRYTQNPLMLMADDIEHPDWACPICAMNWCHAEHHRLCTQEGCDWPKDFDWTDEMISGSVNVVLNDWKALKS